MPRTACRLAALLLLALALPACHRWWHDHGDRDEEVFRDPAETIRVQVWDRFVIALDSNASTGYSWRLVHHPEADVVVPLSNHYDPGDGGAVGAPGTEHWSFLAVGRGETVIEMEYVRSFEHGPPARTAEFHVRVR